MSNLDSLQLPLQVGHMNLLLFDPVHDLLLCPRYLFLNTQVNMSPFYWLNNTVVLVVFLSSDQSCRMLVIRSCFCLFYLFAESLGLDGHSFVCSMFFQDADGTDTVLTCPTVHLDR